MISRLSHATIYVHDQDKAHDFYVNKLGFKSCADVILDSGYRWLTVAAPDQPDLQFTLMKIQPGGSMSDETIAHFEALLSSGSLAGGVFHTDDCRAAYAELSQKGVEFIQTPKEEFYGVEALFKDPFGTWFSLVEPTQMEQEV